MQDNKGMDGLYQCDNKQREEDLRTSRPWSLGLRLWPGGVVPYVISPELGHALGLFHEQARPDRNMYVNTERDNIEAGKESNFDKLTPALQQSWISAVWYPERLLLHYAFLSVRIHKDKKPSITAKDNRVSLRYLSQGDFMS
ncbi:Protein SpAN [Stylophora pistillata]|uniref:Protein SpAN n=1 Tax=Stylophora pistillata TaxID=50429 RepID=A0A2B4S1F3_STYPI|nr:Protein SpAN [Stylophora pistillata]